jgi:hypothetical protein
MSLLVSLLLLAQAAPAPNGAAEPETAARAVTRQEAESPDADVFYLRIPWGPNTFAEMESPSDSFYNRRSWPFARMETKRPLVLGGTEIPVGNYALVLHPNTPKDEGLVLEVRQIDVPEFLEEGNVMTRTPEGRTLWQGPVRFDTAADTTPALAIGILPAKRALRLRIQYGNRVTVEELRHADDGPGPGPSGP